MRILAIDPGSKLGWATNATGRLEWGTEDFRIRNGESSGNRWRRFGEWLGDATQRFHDPEDSDVYSLKVDLIVYERSHFMPKARAAAEIAAGFTTRLEEHCERHGIALQPVAVQTLKAFALPAPKRPKRKKGDPPAPRHDTSKDAMIAAATRRVGIPTAILAPHHDEGVRAHWVEDQAPHAQTPIMSEHEADALWLYWWAEANCGKGAMAG